ncbi:hypothetical protein M422DRAFT_264614 [Sphaerobolus stellatus SS14]|uniref:F-box domain-containing protein n=1 Tax=Sphaerobolus stellatus (strain SS14) TaxID=990650 RepID=A0A0C9UF50_SPHS4|nr:hypothetical protein M422DRAFT_264614 [Sphaerobolus stellatus SS14]
MSGPVLSGLPPEIIEAIVSDIDDKTDLRRLASTCHRLKDIIVPHHIRYRKVCRSLFDIKQWEFFGNKNLYTSRVRTLSICLPLVSPISVPRSEHRWSIQVIEPIGQIRFDFRDEKRYTSLVRSLSKAIEGMKSLRSLVVDIQAPLKTT